jgi:Arm DNA-binding domain
VTNLTDQTLKAMTPPPKGYTILWDGSLKGFGCRISQAGTRAFVVLVASGRPKTIGRYPALTLADARREAKRLLAERRPWAACIPRTRPLRTRSGPISRRPSATCGPSPTSSTDGS